MRYLLLTLLISITTYANALAWTEPVRIASFPTYYWNPAIAVGETLHVVGERSHNVVYLFSSNNGRNWSDPIVVQPDSFEGAEDPDIIYSKGRLHIAYIGSYNYLPEAIYHIASSDGGRTWSSSHIVYNLGSPMLKYPRLAANGDTLFLSCRTNDQLLVYRSFDYGEHWSQAGAVESGAIVVDSDPRIFFSLGRLIYIYQLGLPLEDIGIEIYCRYSDDFGSTWSNRAVLSTPEPEPHCASQFPSAAVGPNGVVMVLWFDYKYGSHCGLDGDILGRVSYDNASTWEPEMRLTYTQSATASNCLILGNNLYAAWTDDSIFGCLSFKVLFSQSDDYGQNWSTPFLISGQEYRVNDVTPIIIYTISQNDTTLHCIFESEEYSKLYYTRSHDFVSTWDSGNGPVLPGELFIGAYPNPFNSSVILTLENPKGGDVEIAIYDLLGKKVKEFTLNGAKEGQIEWDAEDAQGNKVSSGLYLVRASTPRQSQSIRLIYLK